ncbi:hypothetical protein MIND_01131200 [Mycena indigotica]|uniref:Uncharacterized protein n=1 Tax=Mycena indigotica TaxID=2126181 RepID=A0A8H6S751_9AGAR|nr:uncharacterized protein MIND_01131200 [Mycena indigotica]KAF7293528.1 hypothetical protein MIND_01131200 [Mycena indigotica]
MAPCVNSPPTPATNKALATFDILGVIFEACLALDISITWQNDVRQKMALGAVCGCWKLALESIATLWSHIILVPRMPQYYINKVFWLARAAPKRLRIDLDLDSELDIMFLSSIAALLGAKAETVTHISLQYCSHSAWDIFVDHLLAVKPQPTFASLEEFSATPISLGECEFDIEPPPLLGLAVGFCHLNESSPRPFLVAPHITSLALTHVNGPVASDFAMDLLDCLRQTPSLETLALDINEPLVAKSTSHHPIILLRLNHLTFLCNTLYPHACGSLISPMYTPQLRALSLRLASVHNTDDFLSLNKTRLHSVTFLRLIGDISAYMEFIGGQVRLLPSLMGTRLRHLDLLDLGIQVLVGDQFVEILAHALSFQAIRLIVIRQLNLPQRPDQIGILWSLLKPASIDAPTKIIVMEHVLCQGLADEEHSACASMWSWEHGLRSTWRASHSKLS